MLVAVTSINSVTSHKRQNKRDNTLQTDSVWGFVTIQTKHKDGEWKDALTRLRGILLTVSFPMHSPWYPGVDVKGSCVDGALAANQAGRHEQVGGDGGGVVANHHAHGGLLRRTADAHKPSDQIGFWLAVRRRAIDVKRCTDDEMHILTPFASLRVADANASTAMLPLMGLTNWRVRYIGSEMRTTKLLTNLSMIFIMFLTDGWLLGARSGHQDGGHSGGERAFAGGVREGPRGDTTVSNCVGRVV
eukprot:1186291-Prorocentrum_minimum.AAC.2